MPPTVVVVGNTGAAGATVCKDSVCCVQIAALQQWLSSLWGYVHGSLTPTPHASCRSFAVEPITFIWMRITKALTRLCNVVPELLQWPEAAHLWQVAGQMNQHLGLAAGLPPKPLLWRYGGHPSQPASLRLCAMQAELFRLCDLTRCYSACFAFAGRLQECRGGHWNDCSCSCACCVPFSVRDYALYIGVM